METYHGETLGALAGVTSAGYGLNLEICYLDVSTGRPSFFSLEFGREGETSGEAARVYAEIFGVDVVPDSTEEERDLFVNELAASVAGDIVVNAFEGGAYNDTVLYFTGQPDQQGAYSIEQVHGASWKYLNSIPGGLRKELEHLEEILAQEREEKRE